MVRTARLLPSSIVKRSRLQSTLSPRRRIWARIAPPCSAFHSQERSMNAVAAQLATVGALGRQRALDERVDRDRGVVHARQPQGVVALHAAAADQDVDQRVLEGVADVQAAGDVGRRDDDAERRLVRRVVGGEVARLDPPVVHARLYSARRPLGRELGGARWEGFGHPSSLRGATDSIFRTAGARRRAGRTRADPASVLRRTWSSGTTRTSPLVGS